FILGAKGQARGSSGIVSLFSLIDFIQDRVVIEKQASNWSKSLTPQLQSLQAGDGAFFFTPAFRAPGPAIPNAQSPTQSPERKGLAEGTLSVPLSQVTPPGGGDVREKSAALPLTGHVPAKAPDNLVGTLKKIKDTGTITLGHRESAVPFSY